MIKDHLILAAGVVEATVVIATIAVTGATAESVAIAETGAEVSTVGRAPAPSAMTNRRKSITKIMTCCGVMYTRMEKSALGGKRATVPSISASWL